MQALATLAATLDAHPMPSMHRIAVPIASCDKEGNDVGSLASLHARGLADAFALWFSGATISAPQEGRWRDPVSGRVVIERSVQVYAYAAPEAIAAHAVQLRGMVDAYAAPEAIAAHAVQLRGMVDAYASGTDRACVMLALDDVVLFVDHSVIESRLAA